MNPPGLLAGLAGLSLGLAVGWGWFRTRPPGAEKWQKLEEQWPGAVARFFYFVGLPYLAVVTGLLSPRWLGLKGLEYFTLSGLTGLGLEAQQAITLLLWQILADSAAFIRPALLVILIAASLRWTLARTGLNLPADFRPTWVNVFYLGLHWAFYRAIFWQLSGDLYLGVVWGGAWVLLERVLLAWRQQPNPARQRQGWANMIILILTSTLFYFAPNLWLVWLVQGLITVILAWQLPWRMAQLPHSE